MHCQNFGVGNGFFPLLRFLFLVWAFPGPMPLLFTVRALIFVELLSPAAWPWLRFSGLSHNSGEDFMEVALLSFFFPQLPFLSLSQLPTLFLPPSLYYDTLSLPPVLSLVGFRPAVLQASAISF